MRFSAPLRTLWFLPLGRFCMAGYADTVDASLQVHRPGSANRSTRSRLDWCCRLAYSSFAYHRGFQTQTGHYRLLQKDKTFTPHLLVIPTGSSVDFPNLDPFYHNVFSLFNGKRFDLGLYESGSSRTVHFDHDGVSYIFCNIHPEMSAVIVTLSTPYFGVSAANGEHHAACGYRPRPTRCMFGRKAAAQAI